MEKKKKEIFYKHCQLEKAEKKTGKVFHQYVWMPEVFAVVGKYLSINGDDGWLVVRVWNRIRDGDDIAERSRDYKLLPSIQQRIDE